MSKKLCLLISALLALSILFSGLALAQPQGKFIKYKRVIADNADRNDIMQLKSEGCKLRHKLKKGASFECPEGIASRPGVREARIFNIVDINSNAQIGVDEVLKDGIDGNGVTIAVLDTGIDYTHPQLADSYIPSESYDFYNMDSDPMDDHGHGTHVSGIITANSGDAKGVAPGAKIIMYKVCSSGGSCPEDDILAAMEAAATSSAKIMSISLGGSGTTEENCNTDIMAAKVNDVVSRGLTAIIAAGNDGATVSVPACASGAIAVGATDSLDNVVYFSGRGKALDIVAPGLGIYSTIVGGGYGYMSGTSMSTPAVAGVAALLLATDPSLSTADIKNAFYATADPVNKCYQCTYYFGRCYDYKIETTCTPEITGAGVIDAYGAYLSVKPTVCVPSTETCDGKDNDCDGLVDESLSRQCGITDTGACTFGTETCSEGSWIGCDAVFPTLEVCNSEDDNCDGFVDEGDICASSPVPCWTSSYLLRDSSQAKKFCKCAEGTYGYRGYSSRYGTRTVNVYEDAGDNENWSTTSQSSSRTVYRVKCMDRRYYYTNQDYYY